MAFLQVLILKNLTCPSLTAQSHGSLQRTSILSLEGPLHCHCRGNDDTHSAGTSASGWQPLVLHQNTQPLPELVGGWVRGETNGAFQVEKMGMWQRRATGAYAVIFSCLPPDCLPPHTHHSLQCVPSWYLHAMAWWGIGLGCKIHQSCCLQCGMGSD